MSLAILLAGVPVAVLMGLFVVLAVINALLDEAEIERMIK